MSCNCGKPKCDGKCGLSPAVLQIENNECTLFHKVEIPASMGDETAVPPKNGLYRNVLLFYAASGNSYLYSSDGIPTKLTAVVSDYENLTNLPEINGVVLIGNKTLQELGITTAINDAVAAEAELRDAADRALEQEIADHEQTVLHASASESGQYRHLYKDAAFTEPITGQDLLDAINATQVVVRLHNISTPEQYNESVLVNVWISPDDSDYQFLFTDSNTVYNYAPDSLSDDTYYYSSSKYQQKLTAGTNIVISGTTISAVVPNFEGATQSADGTAGLVPAPAAGDDSKFLSGDGTWRASTSANDGTLTIQNNGTDVATFTANQSGDTTANIIVPTKTSDLVNDSNFVENDVTQICGEGSSITLSGTNNEPLDFSELRGNASQASDPTGTNPVPVNTVTGEHTIAVSDGNSQTQTYKVNLGKNVFAISSNYSANGVNFIINSDGSIRIYGTATADTDYSTAMDLYELGVVLGETYTASMTGRVNGVNLQVAPYNGATWVGTPISINSGTGSVHTTGTLSGTGANKIQCVIRVTNGTVVDTTITAQLERGSSVTPFAPYFAPIELRKLGDYQDYITRNGNNWYIHRETARIRITTFSNGEDAQGQRRYFFAKPADSLAPLDTTLGRTAYSNIAKLGIGGGTWANPNCFTFSTTDGLVTTDAWNSMTTAQANTWLQSNPFLIYYPLAESTEELITVPSLIEQLNTLSNADGYDTQTIVTSTPGEGTLTMDLAVCQYPSSLPIATRSKLGTVIVSDGLGIESDGQLSVVPATDVSIGGVKVGDNLTITSDGTLSAIPITMTSVDPGEGAPLEANHFIGVYQ